MSDTRILKVPVLGVSHDDGIRLLAGCVDRNIGLRDIISTLRDCVESLRRLPDTDGAYRATCLRQAEKLLAKLEGK